MHESRPAHSKNRFFHAHTIALALAVSLLGVGEPTLAQQAGSAPRPVPTAPVQGPRFTGYLQPGVLDIMKVLPPAPVEGDTRYETDRQVFKDTRSWEGTAR